MLLRLLSSQSSVERSGGRTAINIMSMYAVCSDNDIYLGGGYKALTSPCMLHGPVLGEDMSLLMMATAK